MQASTLGGAAVPLADRPRDVAVRPGPQATDEERGLQWRGEDPPHERGPGGAVLDRLHDRTPQRCRGGSPNTNTRWEAGRGADGRSRTTLIWDFPDER